MPVQHVPFSNKNVRDHPLWPVFLKYEIILIEQHFSLSEVPLPDPYTILCAELTELTGIAMRDERLHQAASFDFNPLLESM